MPAVQAAPAPGSMCLTCHGGKSHWRLGTSLRHTTNRCSRLPLRSAVRCCPYWATPWCVGGTPLPRPCTHTKRTCLTHPAQQQGGRQPAVTAPRSHDAHAPHRWWSVSKGCMSPAGITGAQDTTGAGAGGGGRHTVVLTTSAGRQCKQAGSSTRWCVRAAASSKTAAMGPLGTPTRQAARSLGALLVLHITAFVSCAMVDGHSAMPTGSVCRCSLSWVEVLSWGQGSSLRSGASLSRGQQLVVVLPGIAH